MLAFFVLIIIDIKNSVDNNHVSAIISYNDIVLNSS